MHKIPLRVLIGIQAQYNHRILQQGVCYHEVYIPKLLHLLYFKHSIVSYLYGVHCGIYYTTVCVILCVCMHINIQSFAVTCSPDWNLSDGSRCQGDE